MLFKIKIKPFALAAALITTAVCAQTPYDDAQRALREQRYAVAADKFEQAIRGDKANADASMYWRAYALYQEGRERQAARQISKLQDKFPDSSWISEARLLQAEYGPAQAIAPLEPGAPELDLELRLFTLSNLMDRDSERALPLVMDLLRKTESNSIRRQALFVLGISDDPAAHAAIAQIARDSDQPGLQIQAIHILGVAESTELLTDLYREAANREVKTAIIHAYIAAEAEQELLAVMRDETMPELQIQAIRALGAMEASEALRELYPTLVEREARLAAIHALAIAEDSEALRDMLRDETDAELRRALIHGVAMSGDENSAEFLEQIYDSAVSREEKIDVLHSLMIDDEGEELAIRIARTETDVELRRMAIQTLGIMGVEDVLADLYADIQDLETRSMILHSMAIAEDVDGIIQVMGDEKNPELRAAAINSLAISDDDVAADFLVEMYPGAVANEKSSIIRALMIMEDAEGLIELMRHEQDREIKREMLQTLSLMDSDEATDFLFELMEQGL